MAEFKVLKVYLKNIQHLNIVAQMFLGSFSGNTGCWSWKYSRKKTFVSTNLTCPLPRREDPKPCDEPCGNRSSSHHQFSCVKNDIAAKPSGCQCQTLPWTWPAESSTDQSEGCNNPSVMGTSSQPEEKSKLKQKKRHITMQLFQFKHLQQQVCWQRTCSS